MINPKYKKKKEKKGKTMCNRASHFKGFSGKGTIMGQNAGEFGVCSCIGAHIL